MARDDGVVFHYDTGWPEVLANFVAMPDATRMTAEQIASLLNVNKSTISSYAARGQMPKPSPCPCCGHSATWSNEEVQEWIRTRPGRIGRPKKR